MSVVEFVFGTPKQFFPNDDSQNDDVANDTKENQHKIEDKCYSQCGYWLERRSKMNLLQVDVTRVKPQITQVFVNGLEAILINTRGFWRYGRMMRMLNVGCHFENLKTNIHTYITLPIVRYPSPNFEKLV